MLGSPEELKESIEWIGTNSETKEAFPVMFSLQVGEGDEFVKGAFKHAGGEDAPSTKESVDKTAATIEALRAYSEVGVTHMLMVFDWEDVEQYKEALRWLAEDVVPEAAVLVMVDCVVRTVGSPGRRTRAAAAHEMGGSC